MNWILGLVTKNPLLLLWIALGAFAAGVVSGGGSAWKVQGWRLDAVQSKFDGFVVTTKAQGEAAAKLKAAQEKKDKLNKEQTDAETKRTLTTLRADVKRMRDARAASRFVPAAASATDSPDRACFNRAQLESAIRVLDSEVSGLAEQGSNAVIKLDAAKAWALRASDTLTPHK